MSAGSNRVRIGYQHTIITEGADALSEHTKEDGFLGQGGPQVLMRGQVLQDRQRILHHRQLGPASTEHSSDS